MKFNTFMVRAGYAHYGNPYEDAELNASRSIISGGLGYRDKGIFIDLTYAHSILKDVHFPYRLAPDSGKELTFADLKVISGKYC